MACSALIVDDSRFQRMNLRNILEENGFEVAGEAGNGNEAAEKYKEYMPDVVLMDVVMPEADGIVGLEKILQADPDAIVIMISSMADKDHVSSCLSKGAKNFISKPYEDDDLIAVINSAMED